MQSILLLRDVQDYDQLPRLSARPDLMAMLGISTFWQGTFVGSFIIVAVAF